MPESFPSCFGEYGQRVQDDVSDYPLRAPPQSSVVCLYEASIGGYGRPVSVTWSRSFLGQGLCVCVDDPGRSHACKVDMRSWRFWKKQGSKSVEIEGKRLEVFWDLSNAKYLCSPEPIEGFYVAVLCDGEAVLLLGDMMKEACKKAKLGSSLTVEATLVLRKEHLFGKRVYHTKAQFEESGSMHDITIECHVGDVKDPWMCIRINKQALVHVQHLMWKFRGNQTIHVDGVTVECLWDAHDWLFNPSSACAVFMFNTCVASGIPWQGGETRGPQSASILEWPATYSFKDKDVNKLFKDHSFASILEWPNTHSFKGVKELPKASTRFSLLLYVWRTE